MEEESPALLIVDRNLPGVEGGDFVRQIRSEGCSVPVIFLTAKDKMKDMEKGFESGADDYITKPFEFAELLARVRAHLRRYSSVTTNIIRIGDIQLDLHARKVLRDKEEISLTNKEFALLEYLILHKNQVVTDLDGERIRVGQPCCQAQDGNARRHGHQAHQWAVEIGHGHQFSAKGV